MNENLFPNLEERLASLYAGLPAARKGNGEERASGQQSFRAYRQSRPVRRTEVRRVLVLSRVGELTAAQEAVVMATGDYLARFFDLPLCRGADLDPATFPAEALHSHPLRGHLQLRTAYLINDVLGQDRPEEALICLAVTAWDLCSDERRGNLWGSGLGEAWYGHAGAWSLWHLGDPTRSERALRGCVRRSCAVATHEALHVLGLDHCAEVPCLMRGSACLSGPLHLCPPCFRKLCWNRQLDLVPYLKRIRDFLGRWELGEDEQRVEQMIRLLGKKPWKRGGKGPPTGRPAGDEGPSSCGSS